MKVIFKRGSIQKQIAMFMVLAMAMILLLSSQITVRAADTNENIASSSIAASGTCGKNATWVYDVKTKTLTISGSGEMYDYDSYSERPWCSYINEITKIEIVNGITRIGNWAFHDCSSLQTVTISTGVTRIEDYAFYNCSSLQTVTIPTSVTSIGNWAFLDCSKLQSIIIPENLTQIGYGTFQGCSSLQTVTIPTSITSIGDCAFYDCSSLQTVTIPESVTSIEDYVFYKCEALDTVIIERYTPPTLKEHVFDADSTGRPLDHVKIYVPRGCENSYKRINKWAIYKDRIQEDPRTYTVTFNENGHGKAPAAITDVIPGNISRPKRPEADGYAFRGWYKEAECINEWNFYIDVVEADTTLYAKWEVFEAPDTNEYVLSGADLRYLDIIPGGITTMNNIRIGAGNDSSISAFGTENDATFFGDFSISLAKGETITDIQIVTGSEFDASNIWDRTAGIYHKHWDGSESYDSDVWGWGYNDCTVTWSGRSKGVVFTAPGNPIKEIRVKYETEPNYTVTFNENGHGKAPTALKDVIYGTTIKEPAKLAETGYTFEGWYKEADCINPWDFEVDTVTADITLYAKWGVVDDENEYVISSSDLKNANIGAGSTVTIGNIQMTIGSDCDVFSRESGIVLFGDDYNISLVNGKTITGITIITDISGNANDIVDCSSSHWCASSDGGSAAWIGNAKSVSFGADGNYISEIRVKCKM